MPEATRIYRGVTASDRAAGRREQLLDAGLELLGTVGYDQTTMTAVCGTAKLTERYFYENFRSRRDLLRAVVDRIADELRESALGPLAVPGGDTTAALRAAVAGFVGVLTDDPRKGRAALIEAAAADFLRDHRRELLRDFGALVVEQARHLFGDDALPPPRDRIGAVMFVGGCAELIGAHITGDIDIGVDAIIDASVHLFTTSMRT